MHTIPSKGQVLLQIVILCDFDVTYVNKLEIMATLIGFCWCPSELSNTSAVAASHEGQLAIVTNDGVFVLVSYKIKAKQSKVKLGEGCSLYAHQIFKQ